MKPVRNKSTFSHSKGRSRSCFNILNVVINIKQRCISFIPLFLIIYIVVVLCIFMLLVLIGVIVVEILFIPLFLSIPPLVHHHDDTAVQCCTNMFKLLLYIDKHFSIITIP